MAKLIVALDLADGQKAIKMAETLAPAISWFKVGLELFISSGPELVRNLKSSAFNVFLDLKFYDIPHTVERAVLAATDLGVNILTLHCQGGMRMCENAVRAIAGRPKAARPLLFGVTALTSFGPGEMPGIEAMPGEYGLGLARLASVWGLDGVVCSGKEAAAIKSQSPALMCLCPGIRLAAGSDDQRRIVTPRQAVAAGADFLVVGRPILEAANPLWAARSILGEMEGFTS